MVCVVAGVGLLGGMAWALASYQTTEDLHLARTVDEAGVVRYRVLPKRLAWRTALTVPLVLGLIGLVLYAAFGAWRPALLIFLNVPAAASGGVVALFLRDLPISMSAIVGFIALFGVAVMNGIVLLSRTTALHGGEVDARQAALMSASERFRPVLMTALVAGIGFLPMALATGVGAEVQRPLATVVIGGLCTSTPLTLLVLPALYARFGRRDRSTAATDR